jgi:hypothetical protein
VTYGTIVPEWKEKQSGFFLCQEQKFHILGELKFPKIQKDVAVSDTEVSEREED